MTASYFLAEYSSLLRILIGFILLTGGGLLYAVFGNLGAPLALLLLVIGILLMLQASPAFQVATNSQFILALGVSSILVILIDFWPVQLVYSQAVATVLQILGIPSSQSYTPHFGGVQILQFVQEAGSGRMVGGEIDNACVGLIVLVPTICLLYLAHYKQPPNPESVKVGIFTVCLVVVGNLGRIVFELWAPAVALAPFEIVHYPLAFLLGICGLLVIIWWDRWLRPSTPC